MTVYVQDVQLQNRTVKIHSFAKCTEWNINFLLQ